MNKPRAPLNRDVWAYLAHCCFASDEIRSPFSYSCINTLSPMQASHSHKPRGIISDNCFDIRSLLSPSEHVRCTNTPPTLPPLDPQRTHKNILFLFFQQGVMESFLGTALAGSVFCLFSGQPLIILSSTGPILIFEKLLFEFSKWAFWEPNDLSADAQSGNTEYCTY